MVKYTREQINFVAANARNMTIEQIRDYLGAPNIMRTYQFCWCYGIKLKGRVNDAGHRMDMPGRKKTACVPDGTEPHRKLHPQDTS